MATPLPRPPRAAILAASAIAACVLLLALLAGAWAAEFPPLTGRVVDGAGLLTPPQREQLAARLAAHEEATGNQVVVATVPDLAGLPIEDYANGLFRHWRLGQAGKDNGVLLLIAPKERRMRIEVGYGLEPVLTDAASKLIIAQVIAPAFREGRFHEGIAAGTGVILDVLGGGEAPKPTARERPRDGTPLDLASGLFLLFLVLLVVWQNYRYRQARAASNPWIRGGRRGRRPGIVFLPGGWSNGGGWGGGGGSGWGGGGGSSGGGGASGDW